MNTDYERTENSAELMSYIVRPSEGRTADRNNTNKKNIRKYALSIVLPVLVLALVFGWYGIGKKAAAYEPEVHTVTGNVSADAVTAPAAEDKTEEVITVVADETEEPATTPAPIQIPSGAELLDRVAKQEVSGKHEENISGLLWNYELITDIQQRAEEMAAEQEAEEYRELLVTMGLDDGYVSENPELPEYLTKTYNPLMDIELSEEEIAELLRLVEAEAPAEDIYGKILVANVVLNRVNHEKMANTVTGVIYEKVGGNAQFSPTVISWYWNSIEVTDSTREAVARCLSGEDYSNGALYFYAWERNPDKHKTTEWMRDLECLFTHGGHRFFR